MAALTIIANIHADLDQIDLVETELLKLIPVTRAEEGCIQFDLHQGNDNPAHFSLYETWESRALWTTHMNAPHLQAYVDATDDAVAQVTLSEMTKIGDDIAAAEGKTK